jgi:hypothetical protein
MRGISVFTHSGRQNRLIVSPVFNAAAIKYGYGQPSEIAEQKLGRVIILLEIEYNTSL